MHAGVAYLCLNINNRFNNTLVTKGEGGISSQTQEKVVEENVADKLKIGVECKC